MKTVKVLFVSGSLVKDTPDLSSHCDRLPRLSSRSNKTSAPSNKKIVCYYTNWSQYRPKDGKFVPEDIDPHICTHIIFAFGWMKKNKLSAFDSTDETKEGKKGLYERITELKNKNPKLKVLLAVGGWSFGTERFKTMASNKYNRRLFIFSAMEYLREKHFDGLDLDWEFPRGNDDKKSFTDLLKELREAFEAEAKEKKLPRLLLTAAVSAGADTVRSGYDVPAVAAYVDFLNIMSYDFHGKWETQTGHNAPLYAIATEGEWRRQLCMDFGVKLWEKLGAPKDKIVVGMATYGRSFTLAKISNYAMNAPTAGGGKAGEYTRESGFLSFYEVCDLLKDGGTYLWDDEQKVPYAVQNDLWVGFDDERSIRLKMKWLLENDYAGAMVWTIDMDDFTGRCAGVKYPLMNVMNEELLGKPALHSNLDAIIKKAASRSLHKLSTVEENNLISSKPEKVTNSPTENVVETTTDDPTATNARVVCYLTNWSQKRPGIGKFDAENIVPTLCTHIIYAFAGLKDHKLTPTEESDELLYDKVIALKEKNPNLKVLLAIGGWMVGPSPFKSLTDNTYRQSTFIFNTIEYLRRKKFDGLDVCWEFPRGTEDKEKYTLLIKELREAFDGEAKGSKNPRLLLTAAVPSNFEAIAAGYNVPEINKYLDFMNIMTYDFHGDWEQSVGHNSPLFPLNSASSYQKKLTVDFSVSEWVAKGASKEKLVVGLPTYGRTFTLANANLTDIGAPCVKGGTAGQFTRESGFLSFFEICDFLKLGATLVWDNEQMVPYAYHNDQWVGFDDPRSFKIKVQWLKQAGYGGIMIWSVDMDDFSGSCMGLAFPLINSAKEELKGYKVANLEAQSSNLNNAIGQDIDELNCDESDGHISYHKDKKDCTRYYMCEGKRKHHMPCPQNLVFNLKETVCDWPENVEECSQALTPK
ncbi:Sar s 18 allergen (chitinase-like protein) [Leptotrombidium deliense]|uniref:Sar s 18 allergen (Chitinase-like protein) n=1 Tax=Leptotrombidium deliense TaxID=299467 RepID=A0A443SQV3_9ACAR|nr:Sar s 18 allergen (chitinase-like protein) [Leptotrombidium deliense]